VKSEDQKLSETALAKVSELEEIEDEALKQAEERRKARLRTRGPYRKARIET